MYAYAVLENVWHRHFHSRAQLVDASATSASTNPLYIHVYSVLVSFGVLVLMANLLLSYGFLIVMIIILIQGLRMVIIDYAK